MSAVRVAIDVMGGDRGLDSNLEAVARASRDPRCHLVLVGDEAAIRRGLSRLDHDPARIEVAPAGSVIPMGAKPKEALEAQPDASVIVAAKLVGERRADALVSAGNSGALVLAAARHIPRIPGIDRAALAAVVPTERRRGPRGDPFGLILDVGATLRVGAKDLVGFAAMGAAYARVISRNERPRVGLLSNGSEPTKGPPEIVEAHALLARLPGIEFVGNVEGIDVPKGTADVVVCDGFTGNVVLKMLEGVYDTVQNLARFAYRRRWTWRLALGLLSSGLKELKTVTDWEQYGGAPILGLDGVVIKAHGRSSSRAIRNAIRVAVRSAEARLPAEIARGLGG